MTTTAWIRNAPRRRKPACGVKLLSAAAISLIAGVSSAMASDPLTIEMDRAKVMRIARPAATVILGNPGIADATIQDRQTLIITGRSFGTTNLIVLDQSGQPVADELLTVVAPNDKLITVYSGTSRQSFSCSPDCQPVMNLGDSTSALTDAKGRFDTRNSFVQGAANGN